MASSVALRGTALHRGGPAEVRLSRRPGPIVVAQRGAEATLAELSVTRADRGVRVATRDGRVTVDLVEHLLAAVAGLGIRAGLLVETDGEELPLLDGSAAQYVEALRSLELAPGPPAIRVLRSAVLEHGRSSYRFAPGPAVRLGVAVDFPPPVGREEASWAGDAADFAARIAPARTFGWVAEYEALRAAGRAAAVDLASVMVFDERGVVPGCRPAGPAEAARHKLLDLIGDLALHGGPPLGDVVVRIPGHAATHTVVAEAFARGVLG